MNAAARLLNQGSLSRRWVVSVFLTRRQFFFAALVMLVAASALTLVYVTCVTRTLNATLQQASSEQDRLHIQWQQLLLEKSTLLMQSRLQAVAEGRLHMVRPEGKSIVIIKDTP